MPSRPQITEPQATAGQAQHKAFLGVEHLTKRFATPEGVVTALEDVSLDVSEGEFLAIIGPSGCGKSTLFNIIGGLVDGYDGKVTVSGDIVRGPHPAIGMVFQEESTFPWRTVLDNVAFPLEIAGVRRRERTERARHFIALVGLSGFERRYPSELSGGMRQRVAIARTLAFEPTILLMDEPFAALDEQTRLLLGEKVLEIQEQLRQTTLLITHNITEAVQLADRILVMTYRPGRVKRVVDIKLPRPRTSDVVTSEAFGRSVAEIWNDLREEATRGMQEDEAHAGQPEHMTMRARKAPDLGPAALGLGALACALAAQEVVIRLGFVSRFIVPLPSEIGPAFLRLIIEEDVLGRFLMTSGEALGAGLLLALVGITSGIVLYRVQLLRRAYETWIAAFASAPIVLMYPLFLVIFGRNAVTIIMMGFAAALPPVILKTIEGLSATRQVHVNVGRAFKLTQRQVFTKILLPSALPTIFVGLRLGLLFALINIVGVEFLINFGGLGQLINDLAERYDLPGTYAAIGFVVLVSIVFFDVTERIERWLRPGS